MTPVAIALAGSLGAVCRFVVDGHIRARHNHTFPWATLIINSSGSLLLGFVSGVLLKHHTLNSLGVIVGVGFCGGYTTFSTASFETVRLLERRRYKVAFGNAIGGLIAALLAVIAGLVVASIL